MGICVDDFPSYPIPIIQLIIKQWFTPDLRCEQKTGDAQMARWNPQTNPGIQNQTT